MGETVERKAVKDKGDQPTAPQQPYTVAEPASNRPPAVVSGGATGVKTDSEEEALLATGVP
jgi:hypothetical protein